MTVGSLNSGIFKYNKKKVVDSKKIAAIMRIIVRNIVTNISYFKFTHFK